MRQTLGRNAMTFTAALGVAALCGTSIAQAINSSSELDRLGRIIAGKTAPATAREEAARRLVDRHSPESRVILLRVLSAVGDPVGQAAVAHAIAADAHPDPTFVGALRSLLGSTRTLTDAAAQALVNYHDDPDSFPQLQNVAANQSLPDGVRTAAVRAMGSLIDKRVAAFLMQLLDDPGQSVTMQNTAADALGDITGLHDNGVDHQRWRQWWAINQARPEDQWRAGLLYDRAREFDQVKRRNAQLTDGLASALRDSYQLVPEAQKNTALLRYLRSDVAEVRAIGADMVNDNYFNLHIDDPIRDRLRSMVGDSDRGVRAAVANTLYNINDRGAADAVVAQLGQELDPRIRVTLAKALGRMDDLKAVPALLTMLNDPFDQDATAAAIALADLGPRLHHDNPDLAASCVDTLGRVIVRRGANESSEGLKSACVSAMAAMRDPRALQTFMDMLRPGESNDVHRAALRGLGNLNDPKVDEAIAGALSDPDAGVRLEAARSLKNVATFAQAEQLYRMLSPDEERDPEVRGAVWQALKRLLQTGTVQQLNGWPDRFKNDPDKRIEALLALRDALKREGNDLQLAYTEQNIGEALLSVPPLRADEPPPRADAAVDAFQKALEFWRGPGINQAGGFTALDELVGQMLKALLASRKYAAAASFAAQQIALNDQYQEVVGPRLRDEADKLHTNNHDAQALQLITEALNMSPPVDTRYRDGLRQLQTEINQKQ